MLPFGRQANLTGRREAPHRAEARTIPGVRSHKKLIYKLTRKESTVKKTGRIKLAREIITRIKKEMHEPRLTESVRNGRRGKVALDSIEPAIRLEKV